MCCRVHNQVRSVIAFLTFESLVWLSAIGLAGVASGCSRTITKAVRAGTIAFALFLIYLGLTIAIKNLFSDACGEIAPYLTTAGVLSAVNSSGAPPNVVQMFEQCMNDELTMDRFVKHADFWNSNIDSGFDSLTNLLPPEVKSVIQEPLNQFVNNSKGAYGTPDLTRLLSGTSEILRVTQAYVNSEYATQVADTSWSEAAEYMAPISRTMAQIQASVVSIEAIFALLDCSTLRQTMQDVNQLLCTDTLDQIKDIYALGVKIIVFLALVIFALMVHGLVMDNPPRHYLCPNQNCGRWFRFKMSLNAHLKVECNQGSCAAVFCQRTSSSVFYACLLFFICIPQGLFIFSLP